MGNQATPVIDAVQDRHIEKVILSGSPFVSAILGSGAYRISEATTPLFFRDPIISGHIVPPSILTCEGQSFTSSPRAVVTYQWKSDTVDIDGETNETYLSKVNDLGAQITCEVTITNGSGFDIVLSNQILMEPVTENYLYQFDAYAINGLNAPGRQDMNELDMYIIAGMPHDMKVDLNQCEFHIITGMQGYNNMTTAELEGMPLFLPEFLAILSLLNGDAENSVMDDWTMDDGNVQSVSSAAGFWDDLHNYQEGARFFKADNLGQGVSSTMSQVIAIDVGDEADVDTGRCYVDCSWIHQSEEGEDSIEVTMEALNAASGVLNTETTVSPINPLGQFNGRWKGWMRDTNANEILHLPTLTRFVKISILFSNNGIGASANGAYADDFQINLLKA